MKRHRGHLRSHVMVKSVDKAANGMTCTRRARSSSPSLGRLLAIRSASGSPLRRPWRRWAPLVFGHSHPIGGKHRIWQEQLCQSPYLASSCTACSWPFPCATPAALGTTRSSDSALKEPCEASRWASGARNAAMFRSLSTLLYQAPLSRGVHIRSPGRLSLPPGSPGGPSGARVQEVTKTARELRRELLCTAFQQLFGFFAQAC